MTERQAASIPNLLSLRGSRVGRGRGRGGHGDSVTLSSASKDKIVQQTDNDASVSRMSAVALGYLEDEFANQFLQTVDIPRRFPIINRGTYIRTTAIDDLVNRFLATDVDEPKQIISLGAGSDTRYFRIASKTPNLALTYHELDFATNTASKVAAIKQSPVSLKTIHSHLRARDADGEDLRISADGASLLSPVYNIHAVDLRLFAGGQHTSLPNLPNISSSTPTLILSECCLIYLAPADADAVLRSFTSRVIAPTTAVAAVIYEPIRPFDSFGQVMISNLAQRGIVLQTLQKYASLGAQKARLRDAALQSGQEAADVDFLMNKWINEAEKERVSKCEMLDEFEEWVLLARHYCIAWGWRDDAKRIFRNAWGDLATQPDDSGVR